jgi:hypothetical protein
MGSSESRYLSESVNFAHALAGRLSVRPSRSVVSRTRIRPAPLAVSTQAPPDVPEKDDLRHGLSMVSKFLLHSLSSRVIR